MMDWEAFMTEPTGPRCRVFENTMAVSVFVFICSAICFAIHIGCN